MNPTRVTRPVCGMTMLPRAAEACLDYRGQTYYFCYAGCKVLFEWNPEKYTEPVSQTSQEVSSP
jgi:P-type Cu+ transporter